MDDFIATPGAIGYIGLGFTIELKFTGDEYYETSFIFSLRYRQFTDFNYPISRYLLPDRPRNIY